MKKQFIVVCIALIAFVSCQKEQGKSLITYRNVDSKTIITVKGAYLYIKSDSNTIADVSGIPDNKYIYSYFDNNDTTIYEVGHCWSASNPKPTIEKDSHVVALTAITKGNGVFVKNLIQELRYFTTYYIRPYVRTKRVLGHNSLTGAYTTVTDIGYGMVDTFNTSGILNSWAKRHNLGIGARQGAVSFVIGDTAAYVGTGDVNGTYANDLWKYSQTEDAWTQCAVATVGGKTMQSRKDAVAFAVGGKGYIGTGIEKGATSPLKDFWSYDAASNTWGRISDLIGSARSNAVGFAIGNYGYVGTGEGDVVSGGATTTASFFEYDVAQGTWRLLTSASFGGGERTGAISFVINGKAYVGTGYDGANSVYKKDMWVYTPPVTFQGTRSDGAWSQLSDLGQGADVSAGARKNAVAVVINGSAYVGYGETENNNYYRDWYKYILSSDTWSLRQIGTAGGEKRKDAIAFYLNIKGSVPRGYIGTGYDGNNLYREDLWEYIPDDAVLTKK